MHFYDNVSHSIYRGKFEKKIEMKITIKMKKKSLELAVYQKMSATMRSTKKTNLLIKFV